MFSKDEMRRHLLEHRMAGVVQTSRENTLDHIRSCTEGDPSTTFGVEACTSFTPERLVTLMAAQVGIGGDPADRSGDEYIDPDLTLQQLLIVREHLRWAISVRARVFLATGHPGHLLGFYVQLAHALRQQGCQLVSSPSEEVRDVVGVHVLGNIGDLVHTHSPDPMRRVLGRLRSHEMPRLVVADHGWAGAAGEHGLRTVGFADCNDPGLFVAKSAGILEAAVPIDDGISPELYEPVARFVLAEPGRPADRGPADDGSRSTVPIS